MATSFSIKTSRHQTKNTCKKGRWKRVSLKNQPMDFRSPSFWDRFSYLSTLSREKKRGSNWDAPDSFRCSWKFRQVNHTWSKLGVSRQWRNWGDHRGSHDNICHYLIDCESSKQLCFFFKTFSKPQHSWPLGLPQYHLSYHLDWARWHGDSWKLRCSHKLETRSQVMEGTLQSL